jgi:hypothetical protein
MKKTKIEQLWGEAAATVAVEPLAQDGYRLLRMDPSTQHDIYAGVDGNKCFLLAVGVRARPSNISIESSSLDYFRQKRADGSWLMVLRLSDSTLAPVFGRLCQDLVEAAAHVSSERELMDLYTQRLNLWRKLFEQMVGGLLAAHKIKGLLGELVVLESILDSKERPVTEAVEGWVGPLEADQDFRYSDVAYEVKAIATGSDHVSISSLEQLECATPLQLVVLELRRVESVGPAVIGLNSLVARIEGKLAASVEAVRVFKDRLLKALYVEDDYYDTVLFEVAATKRYQVTDAFPRVLRPMVPSGVLRASYALDLGALSQFEARQVND